MTMRWYLQSKGDHDTLVGGWVTASCGVRFMPLRALRDRGPALAGYPPDPDQVCPHCDETR